MGWKKYPQSSSLKGTIWNINSGIEIKYLKAKKVQESIWYKAECYGVSLFVLVK